MEFNIGDVIYHKSDSSINWVIEEIDGNKVFCSKIDSKTKKQIKEWFNLSVIEKVDNSGFDSIILGGNNNPYRW